MSSSTPTDPQTPLPMGAKPSITPRNGQAQRQETIRLAIRLGSVVLLTGAVVGFLCLSGRDVSVEQIILVIAAGGALAGLAAAPRAGGGTGTTLIGGALMLVSMVACGCGSAPIIADQRPTDGVIPCSVEREVVEGLDDAIDAVDEVVPDDAPKAPEALAIARGAVDEGRAAVGVCEALTSEGRPGLGAVLPWLRVAMDAARGLFTILVAAGVDLPDPLEDVLRSLGLR